MSHHTPEQQPVPDLEAALASCADEPIRIPGAIQPHGVLLTLRADTLQIEQVSANCIDLLGQPAQALLGQPLAVLLQPQHLDQVKQAISRPLAIDHEPLQVSVGTRQLGAALHRLDDILIMELEPIVEPVRDQPRMIARVLRNLQAATTLESLFDISVHEIQALTGFDRVMIYRLEPQGHGQVIGQALVGDELPDYLGLNFPGSDIPAQARELYRQNWVRVIPDTQYTPAPLIPPHRPDTGQPLDLSSATLRSVSPVHCEYLKNMGVRSSMSISLISKNALWGLIACGHPRPLWITREIREACALIGQLLSAQITAIVATQTQLEREVKVNVLKQLSLSMVTAKGDVFDGLVNRPEWLLSLTNAQGAAVLIEGRLHLFGKCPTPGQVRALHVWIRDVGLPRQALKEHVQGMQGLGIFHGDSMQADYPASAHYMGVASGVIAFTLPKPVDNAVMWFRPQLASPMSWGGNPQHHVSHSGVGTASHRLHPRQSFAVWQQQVSGIALPWSRADLYAAEDLRRSSLENDLARQVQREREAVRLRDEIVAVVSHDLRNPMSIIIMQCGMMQKWAVSDALVENRRIQRALGTIEMATTRMSSLLEDLLDTAKIDAGRYHLTCVPLEVAPLLEDACALLVSLTAQKNIELNCTVAPGLIINADAERIFQVLSNLLGNAIKFTADGGRIDIDVIGEENSVLFNVVDNGVGIAAEHLPHIFQRYWSVKEGNSRGNGLGLYISRGIIEAHGGALWAHSEAGAGSRFSFRLERYVGPLNEQYSHPLKQRKQATRVVDNSPQALAQADPGRGTLLNELNHRVKNTLATVQAIATLTAYSSDSLASFRTRFDARMQALSQAHDSLSRTAWVSIQLFELVDQARAVCGAARVTLQGDDVALTPKVSLTVAMVLHELMSNALHHGAFTTPSGQVTIHSTLNLTDAPPTFSLVWTERLGPVVAHTPNKGVGLRLIQRSIERELNGVADMDFAATGLRCSILIPWLHRTTSLP